MQGEDKDDRKSQGNVDFIHERCQNHMQTRATGTGRETKHNLRHQNSFKSHFSSQHATGAIRRGISRLKFMKTTFRNAARVIA